MFFTHLKTTLLVFGSEFPAMLDFKTKARPSFTAALNESKNPKFLAINHNAVSFEKDTY